MGLKELYENAQQGTYVSQIKGEQNSGLAGAGVNFMDGTRKIAQGDIFQTEFTKYAAGANIAGGAQGTVPTTSDKSYPLSRWTQKGVNLAFDTANGQGPASLSNGFYGTTRFRVGKAGETAANIHKYIPVNNTNAAATGGYINQYSWARARFNASPISR